MATYTAFCREIDGTGTIWISTVQAPNPHDASRVAEADCAEDWGQTVDDVTCIGLAAGDVKIIFWNDDV